MKSAQRENGIALITAVMVVAMTSIAAVAMTQTLQLSTHRTTNILRADQRYLYTLGSEAWARGLLIRDLANEESYDALNEDWAKELPMTVVEEGQVSARTHDLQGRFNLNNLYLQDEEDPQALQLTTQYLAFFQRLLVLLELDASIAQATADWLDPDIQPQFPDGAEDIEYLGLTPPYRTGNTPMADISELRLVKGVTAEAYEKLRPHITALPEKTPLNVNTASSLLLQALLPALDESSADSLISQREDSPFSDISTFMSSLKTLVDADETLNLTNLEPLVAVSSHYFQLETTIRMDNIDQSLFSLLHKDQAGVSVLTRKIGIF